MGKINTENALGTESVGRLLIRLSVPAVTAQLINMLYNVVDRMFIGHIPEVGATALTGVGVTFPIIMIISAFASLIGMGGAPLAAIRMGESRDDKAEVILGNCTTALFGFAVILTLVFYIYAEPLLLLFGASPATLGYSTSYLKIYVLGTPFVMASLGLNSFISTQGFAKESMITVVIGAVINIILDPVFIYLFDMGVSGAALATIISQAVSAVWVVRFLVGDKTKLRVKKQNLRVNWSIIGSVLLLGSAPFIMQSTESLVSITLNTSLQKYGGDLAVGAVTIMSSLLQFIMLPLNGITQGAQPIISYNFGARQFDRVKQTFKLLLAACLTFSTACWLLMMLIPGMFARIFTTNPALTAQTVWSMRIFMAAVFMLGAQVACQQSFIALGEARIALCMALLRKIVLLIPLVYILPNFFADKVFAVLLAEPIADAIASSVTTVSFALSIMKIMARAA